MMEEAIKDRRPLRIAFDALGSPKGGGITFITSVVSALAEAAPDQQFVLLYSAPAIGESPYPQNVSLVHVPNCVSVRSRWAWEQFKMPGVLLRMKVDLVFCLSGFTSFFTRIPQISVWQNALIVNRLEVPLPRRLRLYLWAQRQLQRFSIRKAAWNIFLTQNFADLAATWWDMEGARYSVIHSGIDADRVSKADQRSLGQRDHIVLSIGHTYFHKNYEKLIEAMGVYRDRYPDPLKLVIVGGAEAPQYHSELKQKIIDERLSDVVEMVGILGASEVAEYYAKAKIYAVTSLLESFGLTTLEAMANGLPVLAPNATCFPEVCGDAAVYCDPESPSDIADQLHHLLQDEKGWEELRTKGFDRVQEFSWKSCGEGYFRVVEQVCFGRSGIETGQ